MQKLSILVVSAVLAISSSLFADDIKWVGNLNGFWNTNSANRTADPNGRSNNLYAAGDNVTFDDSGSGGIILIHVDVFDPGPSNICIKVDSKFYTFNLEASGAWGQGFHETVDVIKDGPGNIHWNPYAGAWFSPAPTQLIVRIKQGQIELPHWHEWGLGPFGTSATISFEGGILRITDPTFNNPIKGTHINVVSNSTLINGETTVQHSGTMDRPLRGEPGACLEINTGGIKFDDQWIVNIVDSDVNSLKFTGLAKANLAGGFNSKLVISTNGKLRLEEYVIIDYSGGSRQFTFPSVTGLPPGWSIDYDGTDDNPNSVVLINPEPFVERLDAILFLIR